MEQIIQSSILIIETLAASANLYTIVLEEMGNRVIVITKGAEAVRYLQNNTPDVLIVDLYMIQVAGTNLLTYMRSHDRFQATKTILLTADSQMSNHFKLFVDAVLPKPLNPDLLAQTLLSLM